MCRRLLFGLILCTGLATGVSAQELQARITINSSRVGSTVDKKVFQTLQTALHNFLNNRKWTDDTYQAHEKINCNFLVNIVEGKDNVYKAVLTVQAARPVYNSTYESPLINFQDEAFTFRYIEFQNIDFNENRISGSDGLISNLAASLAYYVYIILGMDYDSFSLRGGDPYFQKAQNIVNNAPDGRDITGWRAFDGLRNRYWLMENMTNSRYALIHEAIYNYYRKGLDNLYENETEARAGILSAINILHTLYGESNNTMIIPFFLQGKTTEIVRVFKNAGPEEKARIREMLVRIDVSNANTYKQELK